MTPILVTTTVSSAREASDIAKSLVEKKLAACVNVLPVMSYYTWQGKIESGEEYKLFIKSFESLWNTLHLEIRALHSYEVPEISKIKIEDIHQPYLDWMKEVLS